MTRHVKKQLFGSRRASILERQWRPAHRNRRIGLREIIMNTPTLVFLVVGVPFALLLVFLLKPEKERAFERELKGRRELDDDAFFETFYGTTDIPRCIPIRLRRIYVDELGALWSKVTPRDNLELVYDDIDLDDLVEEIRQEFAVPFPLKELVLLDGSFDSVVKYLAEKVKNSPDGT